MDARVVSLLSSLPPQAAGPASGAVRGSSSDFKSALESAVMEKTGSSSAPASVSGHAPAVPHASTPLVQPHSSSSGSARNAAAAYKQQADMVKSPDRMSGIEKYKEDQLLRNPGGKHYDLEKKEFIADPENQKSFIGRTKKDLSDAFGNLKNMFGNLMFGSKICYRDKDNKIQEATQRGLAGSVCDFFKNFGSALTFGLWHPDTPEAPQGLAQRGSFFFNRMKRAIMGDLIGGVTNSVNHIGQNAILAGLNLVEIVPDATIGNFDMGRKLSTSIFDNGQVVVEYLTDVIPSGDAWMRVHAMNLFKGKVPVLYNLKMPEQYGEDSRWQYVRNTPFRKTIETIGSLLADVASMTLISQTNTLTGDSHNKRID